MNLKPMSVAKVQRKKPEINRFRRKTLTQLVVVSRKPFGLMPSLCAREPNPGKKVNRPRKQRLPKDDHLE
jgi:hypothetical protein